tara:strand:+ start:359 stop:562 length:204 start_codon:yes stop_codon:yes gene_type:complete
MKTVFPWMHPKHKAGRILHNASQKRQLKGRIQANKDNSLDVVLVSGSRNIHVARVIDDGNCSYKPTF